MTFQAWPGVIQNGGKLPSSAKAGLTPKPIAPFEAEIARAAPIVLTGKPGTQSKLSASKFYREVLAQYHLRPESQKFLNGDYLDRGLTQRRHVEVE